jgi:Uma2 family endonuclease
VAFVHHDRLPLPAERISYLRVVPDLVVEIRSPNDAEADVRAKLSLYLEVGVPLVWIVDPQKQMVEEVRASASGLRDSRLTRADAGYVLEGGDLCPGFGSRLPIYSSDGSDTWLPCRAHTGEVWTSRSGSCQVQRGSAISVV